jgi:hypothetical protein
MTKQELKDLIKDLDTVTIFGKLNVELEELSNLIEQLDEPKECEWKPDGSNGCFCSKCSYCLIRTYKTDNFNYCPNCGAKIKKVVSNE